MEICPQNGCDGKGRSFISINYDPTRPTTISNNYGEILVTLANGTREDQLRKICDLFDKHYEKGREAGKKEKLREVQETLGIVVPTFW